MSLSNVPEISIVIPAYNEASRLPIYLESITAYFSRLQTEYEILIVDDGSTDGTAEVVRCYMKADIRVRLIALPRNCGKGAAVKTGMLTAAGGLRLFADADGATPIDQYERLNEAIIAGADIAIASRALRDDSRTVKGWQRRRVLSAVFNLLVRILLVPGISDTQCGFKLFTAAAAERVIPLQRLSGFSFDVELLAISINEGLCLVEVPVNWAAIPGGKINLCRDSWRMFKDLFKVRMNLLRGVYG